MVERRERGGQAWEQELGRGNWPCTGVGRCRGPVNLRATMPGDRGACATGTETAPSSLQLQCLQFGGSEPASESLGQGKVGPHLAFGVGQGFFGKLGPTNHTPSSSTCCSGGPSSLGTTATVHLVSGIPQDHPQHPSVFLQAPVLSSQ